MICELCQEHSDQIVRAGSLQVCQWCVSNGVLEHALEVESDIAKLGHAIDATSATHGRDVVGEAEAEARLASAYAAYADLTSAMRDLAACATESRHSSRRVLAAQAALDEYKASERRRP
jgi:hypothetical protein